MLSRQATRPPAVDRAAVTVMSTSATEAAGTACRAGAICPAAEVRHARCRVTSRPGRTATRQNQYEYGQQPDNPSHDSPHPGSGTSIRAASGSMAVIPPTTTVSTSPQPTDDFSPPFVACFDCGVLARKTATAGCTADTALAFQFPAGLPAAACTERQPPSSVCDRPNLDGPSLSPTLRSRSA